MAISMSATAPAKVRAEFSWQGNDEGDSVCGRGRVTLGTAGHLVGHFYIHRGDNSRFVAERD